MMKDFQNNEEEEDDDDDDDDVLSDYTKSSLVGQQLKSETTQYSEFANIEDNVQENDNYSDDGFDSPTQQIAGTKSTISAFTDSSSSNSDDSMTEIEFDDEQPQEPEEEDLIISMSESSIKESVDENASVTTTGTQILFDVESDHETDIQTEIESEIQSQNEEVLSTITSTLSSLKDNNIQNVITIDDDLETVETYKSSLEQMDEDESLSFLQSSVNEESNDDDIDNENKNKEEVHGNIDDDENSKIIKMDNVEKSDLIAMDLISEIISNLFGETANLFELRQNRAAILLRQCDLEKSINESIGIFSEQSKEKQATMINRSCLFVESYINEIFKHCKQLNWSSTQETESIMIDFSVFIYIETISNRNEEQQIFNNLIFDTLNEVLVDYKVKCKSIPTQKGIIQTVQDKISAISICDTDKQLKEQFVDEQVIEDRIRLISNEWIQDFEMSHVWTETFDTFKHSMKEQISDLIFDEILCDTAFELNQIERFRQENILM